MNFGAAWPSPKTISEQSQTEGEHAGSLSENAADRFLLRAPVPTSVQRERFAVLGDAGTADAAQARIADQMFQWGRRLPFNQVLVLGDNVYPSGDPRLFEACIARPYQPLWRQGVRFYPVLGNHDVKAGFGDRQLAYWGVPAYYNFKVGPPGQDVEVFALDTTVMVPGYLGGDVSPQNRKQAEAQTAWLRQALAQSNASMKVVMGHYPLFSLGAAAKAKRLFWQQVLAQRLAPILEQYGVDVYLAGHEHQYEAPKKLNGVWYVVSGAGGKLDSPLKGLPEQAGLMKKNHFILFENTAAGLQYQVISDQGQVFDFGLIPRKGQPLSAQP
jgi:UDP-2,3-diacylglucosamine pyrophosphatase LpxH